VVEIISCVSDHVDLPLLFEEVSPDAHQGVSAGNQSASSVGAGPLGRCLAEALDKSPKLARIAAVVGIVLVIRVIADIQPVLGFT